MSRYALAIMFGSLLSVGLDPGEATADLPAGKVYINGVPSPVFFNDGDSFRVLGGQMKGTKARLAGYNTLESHGPVHQWGDWTAKELYVIAKMATLHARHGVWHCETAGKRDTYGRMLMWCPDLAESQVRHGFAHAMSITDEPGKPALLRAQRKAIAERRGIWAHGVPPYILTSIHSTEEDVTGRGTYNRLVSSGDGHSVKWRHDDRYRECQRICLRIYEVDQSKVDEVTQALLDDPATSAPLKKVGHDRLRAAVAHYARFRIVDKPFPQPLRAPLRKKLATYAAQGKLGGGKGRPSVCMIHVVFQRRYGGGRAPCLKK